MAELLGIVASSLTVLEVAAKAGERVIALKRLWDEIKNVPETIKNLMRQIDIIDPVLAQMEVDCAEFALRPGSMIWNDHSTKLSVYYCREAMQNLSGLISDLATDIDSAKRAKRGAAKLKVALKKETLANCECRLQNAVHLLMVAQQCYLA
jgi:hypothetical protein